VKVSSWRPEGAGVVVIDGNGRSSTKKTKKKSMSWIKKYAIVGVYVII